MFEISRKTNGIDIICNNQILMEGIEPSVFLDKGESVSLSFVDMTKSASIDLYGNYDNYKFLYKESDEGVTLELELRTYENSLLMSTNVNIPSKFLEVPRTLSSVGGVKIKISSFSSDSIMANTMLGEFWTRPYFDSIESMPDKTLSLLWQNKNIFGHIICLCADTYKADLVGNSTAFDILVSSLTSGMVSCNTPIITMAVGDNPYALTQATTDLGFHILGNGNKPSYRKKYPEIFEYLGWCSWDAFYNSVNSNGVIKKAKELNEKNVPVKWMIIDDGWSNQKDHKLTGFDEDKSKFPEGLKEFFHNLKKDYGVRWVAVWQAMTGYWNGIHKESSLANEMKEFLYEANNGRLLPYPKADKSFGFWNTWHSYLKECGVDFVKVDNQGSLNTNFKDNKAVGVFSKELHSGLEASVGINFQGNIINCMGMRTESLWNRPASIISRNSDDFYPSKVDNFKNHALCNVYNSVFHRNFVLPDFDMWWTEHEDALHNSVLRAISGGPVYISDKVGCTDKKLIDPLIFSDGRVIRCEHVAVPTLDCLFVNPSEDNVPLKAYNTKNGVGYIALFNVNKNNETVVGKISPSDVVGFGEGKYILYDYFQKKVFELNLNETITVTLSERDVLLYSIIPYNEFTPIGLTNKYISAGGINNISYLENHIIVTLEEPGVFSFVSSKTLIEASVNETNISVVNNSNVYTADCSSVGNIICLKFA